MFVADFLLANKGLLFIVIQGGFDITKQFLKDYKLHFNLKALQKVSKEWSSLLRDGLEFEEKVDNVQTIDLVPFDAINIVLLQLLISEVETVLEVSKKEMLLNACHIFATFC